MAALLDEPDRIVQILLLARIAVQVHQRHLDALVAVDPAVGIGFERVHHLIDRAETRLVQPAVAGRLEVRDARLDDLADAERLVVIHVCPAILQVAQLKEGKQIAVVELRGADLVDQLVGDGPQLVVRLVPEDVANRLDRLVDIRVVKEDAAELALHAAGRLAEVVHPPGLLALRRAGARRHVAHGVDALLPQSAQHLDPVKRDRLQPAVFVFHLLQPPVRSSRAPGVARQNPRIL